LADAERLAQQMVEEAKGSASEEGSKIIAAARAEAEQESAKARDVLREQVAGWPSRAPSRSCVGKSMPACTPSFSAA
jgi:vacuolar-type H+-ATPase subunit H